MCLPRNDGQVHSAHREQNQPGDGDEDGTAGGGFGHEPHAEPWPMADLGHMCCFQKELL